jgi:DNA-binding CsgD family transcriptional regulator
MPLAVRTGLALEACYDAILAPSRWPAALQMLAESVGAASCTFVVHDSGDAPAPVPMSSEHAEFSDLWLRNQPHAPDPHPKRCISFAKAGHASIIEHQVSSEEERRTLPYYWETARPARREWLATAFFRVDDRSWCMPFYRGDDRGPFTPDDASKLGRVGPHIGAIASLAKKFSAFDVDSKLSTLGRVRCAAIAIDALGRVQHANEVAQQLMSDGLNLFRGRLVVSDPANNRRLQHLIDSVLFANVGAASLCQPVVLDRDAAPWLLVEAMPVSAFGADFFSRSRAVLLLTNLAAAPQPDAKLLRTAFGLTSAEARLAALLASGMGINGAATRLGVSRETARTQLKAVFAKTHTCRQAELTGLIARLRSFNNTDE